MFLEIKKAKNLRINPSSQQQQLAVHTEGVSVDVILAHVDIIAAIEYYGMTELLDAIGEESLRSHLESL